MIFMKNLHVFLACFTVLGFALRFGLRSSKNPFADARWVKTLPHIVDTLLLGLGVGMAIQLSISPLVHYWLMAKILGLFAYIGFGILAMRSTSVRGRWVGFIGALMSVSYIFAVAFTKQIVPV